MIRHSWLSHEKRDRNEHQRGSLNRAPFVTILIEDSALITRISNSPDPREKTTGLKEGQRLTSDKLSSASQEPKRIRTAFFHSSLTSVFPRRNAGGNPLVHSDSHPVVVRVSPFSKDSHAVKLCTQFPSRPANVYFPN